MSEQEVVRPKDICVGVFDNNANIGECDMGVAAKLIDSQWVGGSSPSAGAIKIYINKLLNRILSARLGVQFWLVTGFVTGMTS